MLRLRPYKSCDAKYIVNWIDNEKEFVKWCANLITYPFTEESMNEIQESYENNEKRWLFTAVDKKYLERVFPYKDEIWGCYDMAVQKPRGHNGKL